MVIMAPLLSAVSHSISWQAPAAVTGMGAITDDLYTVTSVHEHLSDSGLKCASQHLFIPWSCCPHYRCLTFFN